MSHSGLLDVFFPFPNGNVFIISWKFNDHYDNLIVDILVKKQTPDIISLYSSPAFALSLDFKNKNWKNVKSTSGAGVAS